MHKHVTDSVLKSGIPGGRQKWVNVNDLTSEEGKLINFEPHELLKIKGVMFMVELVQLCPPLLALVPVATKRRE